MCRGVYVHVHVCYICAVNIHATCLLHWYIGTAWVQHVMYIHVHECSTKPWDDQSLHTSAHVQSCDVYVPTSVTCNVAIAPDNTSSCVCIHMYVYSIVHVFQ